MPEILVHQLNGHRPFADVGGDGVRVGRVVVAAVQKRKSGRFEGSRRYGRCHRRGHSPGLHAAHEATSERGEPLEVVHRDVSPQNIMVGTDGLSRVLDFGVAKALGRLQTTQNGEINGKTAYLPPEQLRAGTVDRLPTCMRRRWCCGKCSPAAGSSSATRRYLTSRVRHLSRRRGISVDLVDVYGATQVEQPPATQRNRREALDENPSCTNSRYPRPTPHRRGWQLPHQGSRRCFRRAKAEWAVPEGPETSRSFAGSR